MSSEIFAEKVLATQASAAATAAKASFEKHCPFCQKTYYSENGYHNHVASQKHKSNVAKRRTLPNAGPEDETVSMISSAYSLGDPLEASVRKDSDVQARLDVVVEGTKEISLAEDRPESASATPSNGHSENGKGKRDAPTSVTCLFCNYVSPSIGLNLSHMERFHSMFIPEQEYLVDLDGLLRHLHDKVVTLHECILCGKVRHSPAATQTHMRDMGHCMIAFSTEEEMLEIGTYYDFRSTYPRRRRTR